MEIPESSPATFQTHQLPEPELCFYSARKQNKYRFNFMLHLQVTMKSMLLPSSKFKYVCEMISSHLSSIDC